MMLLLVSEASPINAKILSRSSDALNCAVLLKRVVNGKPPSFHFQSFVRFAENSQRVRTGKKGCRKVLSIVGTDRAAIVSRNLSGWNGRDAASCCPNPSSGIFVSTAFLIDENISDRAPTAKT